MKSDPSGLKLASHHHKYSINESHTTIINGILHAHFHHTALNKPQTKTMGCQIQSLNPQLLYKKTHDLNVSKHSFKCLSSYNINQQQLPVSTTSVKKTSDPYDVKFKTLGSCKLGISIYPDFQYNAEGGTGAGRKTSEKDSNGEISIDFDTDTLYIPPLSTATTKFLGLPLPPFLRIDIVPEVFQGNINQESGKVVILLLKTYIHCIILQLSLFLFSVVEQKSSYVDSISC